MKLKITPSVAQGTVQAPPSKSMAHRLLICAGLSQGESVIENVAFSQDILATLDCLKALGATLSVQGSTVTVWGNPNPKAQGVLPCRESGSTLRFFLPLCLLSDGGTLTGSQRLMERPLTVYEDLFLQRGISLIRGDGTVSLCGSLTSGDFSVAGNVSSQFLTGLLFALPLCSGESRMISTTPLESGSYLDLTLSALKQFGIRVLRPDEKTFVIPGNQSYQPQRLAVEGDESNAAFLEALNEVGGSVFVSGRNPETLQGDRVFDALFSRLSEGFCEISVADCPDLAPILMTVAAMKQGCRLTDTRRLKIKESDRGAVMAEELAKFGADVTVGEDFIEIKKSPLHPPELPLNGHNDHRVVMSMAVICSRYGGIIDGAEAVAKSYPDFFEVLKKLKVRLEEI
ncbi:MAG: 3-phosphoshikimate 1-carboxyvinyltransferase [Clostridia bacterium]|nr:3-phosphoshikimate 1-carboxyvinyltransferase [Clostridia bacterium]